MVVSVDLPDELVEELRSGCEAQNLSVDEFAAEMLYQVLAERRGASAGDLDKNAAAASAVERAHRDRAAGRTVSHQEVVDWHRGAAE